MRCLAQARVAVVLLRAVVRRATFRLAPPGRVAGRAAGRAALVFGRLVFGRLVFGRLLLDGRFEVAERSDALGPAERFGWLARLVDPERAGLKRFTLRLVLGLRPPLRCENSSPDSQRIEIKIRTVSKTEI